MSRLATIRDEIMQVHRARPYKPFDLLLENGSRVIVEHPENIAYDSTPNGTDSVSVYSGNVRYVGPMSAITSIATIERGELEVT